MAAKDGTILALDIGETRIGLAIANIKARLAQPVGTLTNDGTVLDKLRELCEREGVTRIIIGLPRDLRGNQTQQTRDTQVLGHKIAEALTLPISWQDEAVTSVQATAELEKRRKPYSKSAVDALAATYILEDYLNEKL